MSDTEEAKKELRRLQAQKRSRKYSARQGALKKKQAIFHAQSSIQSQLEESQTKTEHTRMVPEDIFDKMMSAEGEFGDLVMALVRMSL